MSEVEEQQPQLSPFDLFLMKHIDRVNAWIAKHKEHQKLPIIFNPITQQFEWMNRKARRKRRS
jgi:hypothetical protein